MLRCQMLSAGKYWHPTCGVATAVGVFVATAAVGVREGVRVGVLVPVAVLAAVDVAAGVAVLVAVNVGGGVAVRDGVYVAGDVGVEVGLLTGVKVATLRSPRFVPNNVALVRRPRLLLIALSTSSG